jgi:uncharacterized protein YdiU (UPF0061 family)
MASQPADNVGSTRGDSASQPGAFGVVFDNWFARDFPELCQPVQLQPVSAPHLVVLNEAVAQLLGADVEQLRRRDGVAVLAGNAVTEGSSPVAQAYSGHQFGGFSPLLGDGRAVLLGEVVDAAGTHWDLQLKGSGRTPFARRGDGRAALGPMLREYLMGEAMHALGVPTTRMLAVVATGEPVMRQVPLPGAVLSRVAASHVRIGTFQFAAQLAASQGDTGVLQRLADHVIGRHHPDARDAATPYRHLLASVIDTQASLVAQWMAIGFIHGVLNTDNVTISGETIDYGPCAFMDRFDPATVFSSIDDGGRYAYGNQPSITQWNLTRLAEAMLPLLAPTTDEAVEVATDMLNAFPARYDHHWTRRMQAKLGYDPDQPLADPDVVDDVTAVMRAGGVDHTSFFRSLSAAARGDSTALFALFDDTTQLEGWLTRWQAQLPVHGSDAGAVAAAMDAVNPVYIPRNHLVEDALDHAVNGDLAVFERLLTVVADPFTERPGLDDYAQPAPADFGPFRTFCGT